MIQPNPRLSASSSQDELFCRKRKRFPEANSKRSHESKVGHYFLYVVDILFFEVKLVGAKKRNADQVRNVNYSRPLFNEVARRDEGVLETSLSNDSLASSGWMLPQEI